MSPWASGDSLTPSTLNRVVPSWYSTGGSYNVKAYGAVGDGATDDSEAIQSAISASVGNGEVEVPASPYLVGTTLRMLDGTSIRGSGFSSRLVSATGNMVVQVQNKNDVSIRHLCLDGSKTSATTIKNILSVQTSTRVNIESVLLVNGSSDGINMLATEDAAIHNVHVSTMSQHGILVGNNPGAPPSKRVNVYGCHVSNVAGMGVYLYGEAQECSVIGSHISNAENGIRLGHKDTGSYNSLRRIVVQGNVISGSSVDGIRLMGREIACVGNVSSANSNAGIKTGGSANSDVNAFVHSVIANNICSDNSNHGIGLLDRQNDHILITGNSAFSNRGQGIFVGSSNSDPGTFTGIRIVGNTCRRNGLNGIAIWQNTYASMDTYVRCQVIGNLVVNNGWNGGGDGIRVGNLVQSVVAENVAYDDQSTKSQAHGFRILGSAQSVTMLGNQFEDGDHLTSGVSLGSTSVLSYLFAHNTGI